MTGIQDDLATLDSLTYEDATLNAVVKRVEAEINEMRQVIREEHAAKAMIGGGPCVCKFCRT